MWNPVYWCCARRADHPGSTDSVDPDDGHKADRQHEDYMYVTDLLADVYSAGLRYQRPNTA
jgi:hypothetical protein